MAAAKFVLNITAGDGQTPIDVLSNGTPGVRSMLAKVVNMCHKLMSGAQTQSYTVETRTGCTAASGTLTLSSASGSVGGSINGGTAVTVTASGGDNATATALAAAINASSDALIKNIVTASASGAVVTITAAVPGIIGNCITLSATGTNVTASGARLTGGSETIFTYAL